MFTEATDQPCVSAWVLDQIESTPGITSADLRELVPPYMKPRSVAPSLTKLTADGAVERRPQRTEAGGNTFAYVVIDRDAATAHLTRPFRHLTPGDRPKGVTRNRKTAHELARNPDLFTIKDIAMTEPRIEIDAEDNVTLPTFGDMPGNVGEWLGDRPLQEWRPLQTTPRPTFKLTAIMSDGTEYQLPKEHVHEMFDLLGSFVS